MKENYNSYIHNYTDVLRRSSLFDFPKSVRDHNIQLDCELVVKTHVSKVANSYYQRS